MRLPNFKNVNNKKFVNYGLLNFSSILFEIFFIHHLKQYYNYIRKKTKVLKFKESWMKLIKSFMYLSSEYLPIIWFLRVKLKFL